MRRRKGEELELLWGRKPPRELIVSEHGLSFAVDLYAGQKTGLFLDHRDNRQRFGRLAGGQARAQSVLLLGRLLAVRGGGRRGFA